MADILTFQAAPKHYTELLIWKKGMELAKAVHHWVKTFPEEEKDALASDIRVSAVNVPSKIAGGFVQSDAELRYEYYSQSSYFISEVLVQLDVAQYFGYGDAAQARAIETQARQLHDILADELVTLRKVS